MPDQPLLDAFGKRIRTLRTDRGLSQEQLAELTGFHRTYIGMIGLADCHFRRILPQVRWHRDIKLPADTHGFGTIVVDQFCFT